MPVDSVLCQKKYSVFTFSQSGKKPEWVCIEVEQMLNTFDIKIVCGELIVRKRNLSKSIHLQHIYLAGEFHILLIIQQQISLKDFMTFILCYLTYQHILLFEPISKTACEKNFGFLNLKNKPKVKLIRKKFSVLQLLSKQTRCKLCRALFVAPCLYQQRAEGW